MRVLVCDDHVLLAELVAEALVEHGIEAEVASSPEQGLVLHRQAPYDVWVLDVLFPDSPLDAARTVPAVLAVHPGTRVLVLTSHPGAASARRALRAGAHALLDKSRPLWMVAAAVAGLGAGRPVRTVPHGATAEPTVALTERERAVLELLAVGCGTAEVADRLGISVNTVRKHAQHLLDKLGVGSRLEAVAVALQLGLVRAPRAASSTRSGRTSPAPLPAVVPATSTWPGSPSAG